MAHGKVGPYCAEDRAITLVLPGKAALHGSCIHAQMLRDAFDLQWCDVSSSNVDGVPCVEMYSGAAHTIIWMGNSCRPITPSLADVPILKPTSTRSSTQFPIPSSSWTSGWIPGYLRQNSSSKGMRIAANDDFGPTMRSGLRGIPVDRA